jgi:hypothetical protein
MKAGTGFRKIFFLQGERSGDDDIVVAVFIFVDSPLLYNGVDKCPPFDYPKSFSCNWHSSRRYGRNITESKKHIEK